MSRRRQAGRRPEPGRPSSPAAGTSPGKRRRFWGLVCGLIGLGGISVAVFIGLKARPATPTVAYVARPTGTVTFSKDIAPIVYQHCSTCHRPGQSGPFALLTYAQVKKHAKDVAAVTRSGYMPPWPPEPGYGKFVGERRLSAAEMGLLQQWVAEGEIEGSSREVPPAPDVAEGWQLGQPDLEIHLPEPYTLPPAGKDVYRNFVIPIPLSVARNVQAVELRPGNRSAHHAFILYDRTRQSRRLDEADPEPGFSGMSPPPSAAPPPGQFVTWQPGKVVRKGTADSIWRLQPNTDLVLQMHLQPTGKPELIQPSLGFYFTDLPPSQLLSKVSFSIYSIDIPPGASDYAVSDSFQLPVDAEVLAILPHAHYLGKQVEAYALLPDGTRRWLLLIKHWDFNWQGDYEFCQPVPVPRGSTLTMRWTFDNSTNNRRNPHNPPERVRYGVNTTDEMAELSIKVRVASTNDLARLESDLFPKTVRDIIEFNSWRLSQAPNDAKAHAHLGQALLSLGNRQAEALQHLQTAVRLAPDLDEAHYALGLMFRDQNRLAAARNEFETVLRLNPEHGAAHGNLAFILAEQGELDKSEQQFRTALELNPEDDTLRASLAQLLEARAKLEQKNGSGSRR